MTYTVEITQPALNQRSPAESKGKGQKFIEAARPEPTVTGRNIGKRQKLIEAARPERAEALSPGQRPG